MNDNEQTVRNAYREGSYARLFWDEQLKAASTMDSRQVWWHPVLVKWCHLVILRSEWAFRKKSDLKPYTSVDDDRFTVSNFDIIK